MKKRLLASIFFLVCFCGSAQQIQYSLRTSKFSYIFQLKNEEVKAFYKSKGKAYADAWLHTKVDSVLNGSDWPNAQNLTGNFLKVTANHHQLIYELIVKEPFQIHLSKNKTDFGCYVQTSTGQNIENATVKLGKKTVPFDLKTKQYLLKNRIKPGSLSVSYLDKTYFYEIKGKYPKRPVRIKNVILFRTPLQYIVKPINDLKRAIKYSYRPSIFYKLNPYNWAEIYENKQTRKENQREEQIKTNSVLILNKPKYLPRDTVFFKAIIQKNKNEFYTAKLVDIYINFRDKDAYVNKKIAAIKPYQQGFYEGFFVLNDSLKIPQGVRVSVSADDPEKDIDLVLNSFQYADYELKSTVYTVAFTQEEFKRGDKVMLKIEAKDESGLPLSDVWASIKIKTNAIAQTVDSLTFIPNELWKHETNLNANGETDIQISDSVFSKVRLNIKAEVNLKTSDNKVEEKEVFTAVDFTKTKSITAIEGLFDLQIQGDSIAILPRKNEKFEVIFNAFGAKRSKLFEKKILVPYKEKLNSYVASYEAVNESVSQVFELEKSNDPINIAGFRTKDSLFISIQNSAKINVWYSLYHHNKRLKRAISVSDLMIAQKAGRRHNYHIYAEYYWGGELKSQEYAIPFRNKQLFIESDLPAVVSPSEKILVNVTVTDAFKKPVSNVDLTAFAITSKFKESVVKSLQDFSKQWPSRKIFNEFNQKKFEAKVNATSLNYPLLKRVLKIDTTQFYQLIYPETGYFQTAIKMKNRTEFAPFVVQDGQFQTIHFLYVDNVLVYMNTAKGSKRYSFGIISGRHTIEIRTAQNVILLKNHHFKPNEKQIFSIDVSKPNQAFTVKTVSEKATEKELFELKNYVMHLNTPKGEHQYIEKDDRVFFVGDERNTINKIGPIEGGPVTYKNLTRKSSLKVVHKGNFDYYLEDGQVTLMQKSDFKDFILNKTTETDPNFLDSSWTKGEIKKQYETWEKEKEERLPMYFNAFITDANYGKLLIKWPLKRIDLKSKNILLFKETDPNFLKIYPGFTSEFHQLEEGLYRILILFEHDKYTEFRNIYIKTNGSTIFNINKVEIKNNTLAIKAINEKVINFLYGERKATSQKIKEIYYYQLENPTNWGEFYGKVVTGIVRDENGDPLPGVSVYIKGTNKGCATDINGRFTISTPKKGVLVFSYLGFQPEERIIGFDSYQDIQLTPDNNALEEVVVVAYGVQTKKSMTAAVSVISENKLQGRVAGLMIRGNSSITEDKKPLILLDGKPFEGNIEDIAEEDMELLNGSAATSLYGSKAANGVILISKKPKNQKNEAALRTNFKDHAFWQPKLKTNKNGKGSFEVKFPDDITTWQTQFLAMSQQKQTGSSQFKTKVFKPLVAELSIPRFLVEGDSATIKGKIKSYLAEPTKNVSWFEQKGIKTPEKENITASISLDSTLVVAQGLDSLKIRFYTKAAKGSADGEERKVPVYRKGTIENLGLFIYADGDTSLTFQAQKTGSFMLQIIDNVANVFLNEVDHIKNYEYLCNEQLASKLIAYLIERKIYKIQNKIYLYDADIKHIINKLSKNQNNEKTWGWWQKSEGVEWISTHVRKALKMAKANSFEVSIDLNFRNSIQKEFNLDLQLPTVQLDWMEQMAEDSTFNLKQKLNSFKAEKLSLKYELKLSKLRFMAGLNEPLDFIKTFEKKTILGGLYYEDTAKTWHSVFSSRLLTLKIYELLKLQGNNELKLNKIRQYFFEERKKGYWINTYESTSIMALLLDDMALKAGDSMLTEITVDGKTSKIDSFPYTQTFAANQKVSVRKRGASAQFISVNESFLNSNPPKVAGEFKVKTYFEGLTNEVLKAGETVTLVAEIENEKLADYVMIEVPIPAGCSYYEEDNSVTDYYYKPYFKEEFRHKTNFYVNQLSPGKHIYKIKLVPTYSGTYSLNSAKSELMYFPFVYGREAMKTVKIK